MVRRAKGTLNDVTTMHTLHWAYQQAAQGKRLRPEVRAFETDLEGNLSRLGKEIRAGEAPKNEFWRFQIRDPKPRVIHAPIFEDRVAHHALTGVIGPTLDGALVDDTFACRKGKGSLAAVHRAQHHLRRHEWYAKIDIKKYFASIPHERIVVAIAKKLGDRGVREMVRQLIFGFCKSGYGLPIGALTSQHFANYYLGAMDRCLQSLPKVRAMVRYMDDAIWWCQSKAEAQHTLLQVRSFVERELGLRLKGDGFVQRSRAGLSFLGFRIYPGTLRLSRRRMRRYCLARAHWEGLYLQGTIDALGLQQGYASAFAITAHADAAGFRKKELSLRPAPDA